VSEKDYVFTQDPDERNLRNSKMQSGLADSEAALAKLATRLNYDADRRLFQAVKMDLINARQEPISCLN
jgi:hypothetical protein